MAPPADVSRTLLATLRSPLLATLINACDDLLRISAAPSPALRSDGLLILSVKLPVTAKCYAAAGMAAGQQQRERGQLFTGVCQRQVSTQTCRILQQPLTISVGCHYSIADRLHLLHVCGQHQINHILTQPGPCSPASYPWPTPGQSHPCAAQPSPANREGSSIQRAGTGLSNAHTLPTMATLYHTGRQYRVRSEPHAWCLAVARCG